MVELPLFPLPLILFLSPILSLQIFKFRYHIMMHTLLHTNLYFGIIYTNVVLGTANISCIDEVIKHERLGQERFRMSSVVRNKPYLVAQVTWLEDRPSPSTNLDLDSLAIKVKTNELRTPKQHNSICNLIMLLTSN
ncbi:hypothetical protein GmHk_14G041443 [Glycine max]|nr:hypothetical protein GmHk_14G041443 [Glycine max]